MGFKQSLNTVGRKISKHSPAIFTTVGVAGFAATAYLAYKSRDKVEAIVEEIEEKRDNDLPVDKLQVVRDLTGALALPITTGVLSGASIIMAHRIQRKRILTLAGALAAQQARNAYFETKYRKTHGDEAYDKFMTPTDEVEEEVTKNGKTKTVVKDIKKDVSKTIGQWYCDSQEYASDDHTYNVAFIDSVNEKLQTKLFQRGNLLLNEVREALGFERIRSGALLGWTGGDNFDIRKVVMNVGNESLGEAKEQIWVTWSTPRYIYDDVEFEGRYSPFQ